MRLPRVDSATFRGLLTAVQTFAGFLAVLLVMPEFRELVTKFYPAALPLIPIAVGIVSFVINLFRTDVKNY